MHVHAHFLLAIVLGVPLLASQPAASVSPADLARAIQQKYDTVSDFSADFEHSYHGGVLRKEAKERGTVLVRKPARMRWTYEFPERKVFVSDGNRIYSYMPEDKQVLVSPVPTEDDATTPALFLSGKGNLVRDFSPSAPDAPDALPGTLTLKLTPRRREAEYDWLILVVDRATYRLRRLITADAQGGQSTFTFTNVRENIGIPDKEFHFTIPRGVDVVTNGQPGR
ncbi:MAG: outer membrane lipoprotein carrier protein LolA [Acidobacteria bacterium]|nr:outer membrane lipoprotein carrier protein LolA [Acidobacteriota bacterium]